MWLYLAWSEPGALLGGHEWAGMYCLHALPARVGAGDGMRRRLVSPGIGLGAEGQGHLPLVTSL